MATIPSAIALVLCLGCIQCQPDFGRDFDRDRGFDRNFDRDFDPEFQPRRVEDLPERDQTLEECREKVMDIYFVLDSSTSIWVNDFERERQFVREVVRRLDVGQRTTRVGILTFSDDIQQPTLGFSNFQTKNEVLATITEQNLPYRTGVTNTDKAIRYVRENSDFRHDITKVIVVVTDGGSRSPGATAREALEAQQGGFYLFVVGVGQYLDEREWRNIASSPDESFIFNITNFRHLDSLKYSLPPRACNLPPLIIGSCHVSSDTEIMFVAGSTSVNQVFELMEHISDRMDDPGNQVKVSAFMDICNNAENIEKDELNTYCNRFQDPVDPPTSFRVLLNQMRSSARASVNSRQVRQVAVLFLDEETIMANRRDIVSDARNIEREGIDVIVVDLGVGSFGSILQQMTTNRNNVVRFLTGSPSTESLIRARLINRTCQALRFESGIISK